MQQTLSIKVKGDEVISKPFDFETMCIVNDAHYSGKNGALNFCRDAVLYMFEGTKATEAVINALPVEEHSALCLKVWKIYTDILTKASKNA